MADLFFADLVRETSTGTGTGALPLGGAMPGHRRFADTVPAGTRFHYAVAGVSYPAQWETGEGELSPGGALLRTPLASSAGGATVDFSAGVKTVTLTVGAAWFADHQARALPAGAPLAIEQGGTGGTSAAEARDNLGLVIGTDVAAFDATLQALSGLDAAAGLVEQTGPDGFAKREIGAGSPASIPTRGDADARYAAAGHGHAVASVAGLQAALDGKQAADAELTALAGLASAADRLPYFSGAGAASLTVLTSFGRSLIDDADAAAARLTIGLGNAENKTSATIRSELTSANVTGALGFTPANKAGDSFGGAVSVAGVFSLTGDQPFPGAVTSEARIYRRATSGLSMYGAGTSFDFALFNKNGGNVMLVPTGTQNLSLFGTVSIGSAQVLGARRTGWAAATGTAARTTFDTGTATTAQLAERLKALIDDLIAHGLIGS